MVRRELGLVGRAVGLAVVLAGLAGCGDQEMGPSGFGLPGAGSCHAERWIVTADFTAEQVPEPPPDQLQTATLRVGDAVSLRADGSSGCDIAVARVEWLSSRSEVARITPTDALTAELRALGTGETVVEAEVTLVDGERQRAELRFGAFDLVRIYAVRVVR